MKRYNRSANSNQVQPQIVTLSPDRVGKLSPDALLLTRGIVVIVAWHIQLLNALVSEICYVEIPMAVERHTVRLLKLACFRT